MVIWSVAQKIIHSTGDDPQPLCSLYQPTCVPDARHRTIELNVFPEVFWSLFSLNPLWYCTILYSWIGTVHLVSVLPVYGKNMQVIFKLYSGSWLKVSFQSERRILLGPLSNAGTVKSVGTVVDRVKCICFVRYT